MVGARQIKVSGEAASDEVVRPHCARLLTMWTKSPGQRRVDSTSRDSRRRRVCSSPPSCTPSRPPGTATYCSMLWTLLGSPANSNRYGICVPGRTRRRPCRSPALPPPPPAGPRQAAPARELGVSTSPAGSTSPSHDRLLYDRYNEESLRVVFATLAQGRNNHGPPVERKTDGDGNITRTLLSG